MNTRQKVGLAIIAPMFAFAVGHTVLNKMNCDKNNTKTKTEITNIDNALRTESEASSSLFKARQKVLNSANKINNGKITNSSLQELINANEELINANNEFINKQNMPFNVYDSVQ